MTISLHRLARTTPTIRREIAISNASIANLARRYHITDDLPQSALGSGTPVSTMKQWFKTNPELFYRKLYDRTECDT